MGKVLYTGCGYISWRFLVRLGFAVNGRLWWTPLAIASSPLWIHNFCFKKCLVFKGRNIVELWLIISIWEKLLFTFFEGLTMIDGLRVGLLSLFYKAQIVSFKQWEERYVSNLQVFGLYPQLNHYLLSFLRHFSNIFYLVFNKRYHIYIFFSKFWLVWHSFSCLNQLPSH